ncbi:FRG domain-containing protein [Maribacter arcticus]|uniref:FRG domain-containing protein n=1 Tax=Maribacter arcticus TaxID=561365 RepID=A0A1T5AJE5_9FLAO|nr:FRG domain-containing protein [Maribacter arcticus]SKB35128.1 FRG domain-containing protein [Maribacter arcticus]
MSKVSNLDLKIQLTNEFLRNGGLQSIRDNQLLEDLINFNKNDLNTVTTRLNAFMSSILGNHITPPYFSESQISEYESFLQKSNYFDQIQIDKEEEFDKVYELLKGVNHMLFRGQRESRWRLYSKLQRFWIWHKLYETENNYLDFLQKMVKAGKAKYQDKMEEILEENHMDAINEIAILGFLQHHETPTPLLDWTYSFQNSLFFGTDNIESNVGMKEIDNYFSVYYIQEKDFGQGGMRKILDDSLNRLGTELKLAFMEKLAVDEDDFKKMKELFEERSFFDTNRIKGSGLIKQLTRIENLVNIPVTYFSDSESDSHLIFSLTNSGNIKNQKGVFIWNADVSKPLEIKGNELYNESRSKSEPEDYRFSGCYNINKELAPYILAKLEKDGVTREFIYPDSDLNTLHIYEDCKRATTK